MAGAPLLRPEPAAARRAARGARCAVRLHAAGPRRSSRRPAPDERHESHPLQPEQRPGGNLGPPLFLGTDRARPGLLLRSLLLGGQKNGPDTEDLTLDSRPNTGHPTPERSGGERHGAEGYSALGIWRLPVMEEPSRVTSYHG